jgi:hypothetical protein
VINMILGITALVHNQSKLGFSRDRGGVSFWGTLGVWRPIYFRFGQNASPWN